MSIKQLVGYIGEANIADQLSEEQLIALGSRVKKQFTDDLNSMKDWTEGVKHGVELMKPEFTTKSTPWEGASNYKDPMLTQASIQFGDKAVLELLRSKDLVSNEVVGRDENGEKKIRADRVTEAMNYQVNHDMNKWRKKHAAMLYTLPNTGTTFKKTVHDPIRDITESFIIRYPDFAVNQATEDMEEARSFSHIMDFSKNEIEVKVRSGLWIDADLDKAIETGVDKQGEKGSNEDKKVTDAIDNQDKFIEQQTFFDLDDDDYEEPYIVTIHHSSSKVVRVVPRFDLKSIIVKVDDVVMPLPDAMGDREEAEVGQFGGAGLMALIGIETPDIDEDEFELLEIAPFQQVTKYGFIPAPDGTFLDFGYSHLLGAITQSINTSTNQLTDRATLNNIGGGLLSKEFRKSMGISSLKTGQYIRTEVPADKFQKGILPNPTGEPSLALSNLNEKMQARAREFQAVTDLSGSITAQTAPTTALAMIQEAMISTSALFKRILDATSEEFQVLFRINQRTFSQEKYQEILDDPQADPEVDFNAEGMDIIPTANAEMSSKMQRIQVAQLELEQFQLVLQTGGNPVPLVRNYFESIGSTLIDQIYPEEGTMSPAEQKQLEQLQQQQELANQIQMMQLQILEREQDRLDADTKAKIEKVGAEIKNLQADFVETMSSALLNTEKAETEQVDNQINVYTSRLQGQLDILTAIGAENDRSFAQSTSLQTPGTNPRTIQ